MALADRRPALPPDEAIRAVIRALPTARVASYGQVAALAGLPGRARLVGRVLRCHDGAPPLPWHRVLRSDGRIAFPVESEPFAMQCARLSAEGVLVRDGRVDLRRFGLDLDAVLWGPGAL